MAFCINCGKELAEGAKFCANCGKAANNESPTNQRETVYEGNLHKCPNCGDILNSFVANCPSCGHEIRDTQGASSVKLLAMKLEQIESKRSPNLGSNILSKAFSGTQSQSIDAQKIDLIKNSPIPNTKEDVREFIILASSNIDVKLYGMEYHSSQFLGMITASQKALSDAWLAKFEQAYQKAQLLFGGTQEFINIQVLYERKMKEIDKKKWQFPLFIVVLLSLPVFILLLAFLTGSI